MVQEGPPDLDEVLRKLKQQLHRLVGGSGGGGTPPPPKNGDGTVSGNDFGKGGVYSLGIVALLAIVVIAGYNCVHVVNEQERGVVLRFGKYVTTLRPGLNIRLPRPIERVFIVNVSNVRRHLYENAVMLTSDENLVNVSVAVQYDVTDPVKYIFNVRDPESTLIKAVESAVREVVGKNELDFVITDGRREISIKQRELLQQTIDRYETGLGVVGFELLASKAPQEVSDAFDDATAAREDNRRLIEEAEAYRNDIIPRARGNGARLEEESEAYKNRIVESANGEAERFSLQYESYARSPEITRQRLYIDTMQEVLQKTSKTIIGDIDTAPLLYLPLDKMLDPAMKSRTQRSGSSTGQAAPDFRQGSSSSNSPSDAGRQRQAR